jgi:hypothetical protein
MRVSQPAMQFRARVSANAANVPSSSTLAPRALTGGLQSVPRRGSGARPLELAPA